MRFKQTWLGRVLNKIAKYLFSGAETMGRAIEPRVDYWRGELR